MRAIWWFGVVASLGGCDLYTQTVSWRFEVDTLPGDCQIAQVAQVRLTPTFGGVGPAAPERGNPTDEACSRGSRDFTDGTTGRQTEPFQWEGRANGMVAVADVIDHDRADLVFTGATLRVRWTLTKGGVPITCPELAAAEGW